MHLTAVCGVLALLVLPARVQAQTPVPVITNLQVSATVSYDSTTQTYTYQYSVTNPSSDTGNIFEIAVDLTTNAPLEPSQIANPIPEYRSAVIQSLDKNGIRVIPVSVSAPSGWDATNLTAQGTADWGGDSNNIIKPGGSLGGFTLTTQYAYAELMPGIRTITAYPDITTWGLYPDVENDSPAVQAQKEALINSLNYVGSTLGPVVISGVYDHWDRLRDDLNRAIQLGWVSDTNLANALVTGLAAARQALDANDGTTAKQKLQTLLATLAQSTPAQRREEVYDLVLLNVNALLTETPNTPVPFEPSLTLSPKTAQLPLGAQYTLTATLINLGDNTPLAGYNLSLQVTDGPDAGLVQNAQTDNNGHAVFGFTGTKLGTDKILVSQPLAFNARGVQVAALGDLSGLLVAQATPGTIEAEAQVTWAGGPDLVVPLFVPPVIDNANGGDPIDIIDQTTNIGTTPAGASTTRYYISPNPSPFDVTTARVIGERAVPALAPGAVSQSPSPQSFHLPSDLPFGRYYLAACADADNVVAELNETNNCSFSALSVGHLFVVGAKHVNLPPDCSKAKASPALLWPPDHKLVTVSITGVTEPEKEPFTIKVTKITQDEPVNGLGDGDTSPDGFGIGQPQAQLRAERSGTGNGRVYVITFTATDTAGAACTGTVTVGVPHDQGEGSTPIDDGQRYDSTLP